VTLQYLLELLQAAGVKPHVEDVLDVLWLAQQCRELKLYETTLPAPPTADSTTQPSPDLASARQRAQTAMPSVRHGKLTHEEPTSPKEPKASGSGELPVYSAAKWGGANDSIKASPVVVPAGHALPGRLSFGRALKPFRRRWASRREMELDEELTVQMTADRNGELYPVFRPRAERWFDVDVILEDDAAILVWQDVMRDLSQVLRDTGAFREVRRWRLRTQPRPLLEAPGGSRLSTAVIAGGSRRLIFFVTHGSSLYWADGTYARLIEGWTRFCSIAILQVLPPHRWNRTLLGEPAGLCVALEPGIPSARLHVDPFWWSMAAVDDEAGSVLVPVAPLEAAALGEFALMQMARARRCPVVALAAAASKDDVVTVPSEKRDVEREIALLREKSQPAFQLAVYLSAGPFTLPVARLVQEAMFGSTAEHVHLADVLLSNVLEVSSADLEKDDPNLVYYDFQPEARRILMRSLREMDARRSPHPWRPTYHVTSSRSTGEP